MSNVTAVTDPMPTPLPPGLERLYKAARPFVMLVKRTSGRIPTEYLSAANWHELTKAYDQCSPPVLPAESTTAEPKAMAEREAEQGVGISRPGPTTEGTYHNTTGWLRNQEYWAKRRALDDEYGVYGK